MKRPAFTVLELLVASLLLSMLVTVLTMIFNQSSIAWRTGIAANRDFYDVRSQLGVYHDVEDDALPRLYNSGNDIKYRTVSIFSSLGTGRLYEQIKWPTGISVPGTFKLANGVLVPEKQGLANSSSVNTPKGSYIVGVRSHGPDKLPDTDDDISTFPEEGK